MANYQLEQTGAEVQALLNAVESPDTTPVAGSSNLITSGAVHAAVAGVSAEVTALGQEVDENTATLNGAIEEPPSVNLFDKTQIVGGYVSSTGGFVTAPVTTTYASSPLIEVKPNHYYGIFYRTNSTSNLVRCLDEDGVAHKVLSYGTNSEYAGWNIPNRTGAGQVLNGAFKTPATAKFIQFTIRFNGTGTDNVMLVDLGESSSPWPWDIPAYQDYALVFKLKDAVVPDSVLEDIADTQDAISQVTNEETSPNLFDKNAVIDGYFVNTSNGDCTPYANSVVNVPIPIIGGHYYLLVGRTTSAMGIVCYDANSDMKKVLIASTGTEYAGSWQLPKEDGSGPTANGQFKAPSDAVSVRFTIKLNGDSGSPDAMMLIDLGTTYTPNPVTPAYRPYGKIYTLKGEGGILSLLNGKTIRIFGGSIARLSKTWGGDSVMEAMTGCAIQNDGLDGGGFCNGTTISGGVPTFAANSIPAHVNAAVAAGQPKYDIYVLWASTNDVGKSVGTPQDYTYFDNYDVNKLLTQNGGINYCIKALNTFAPEARIIVIGSMKYFDGGANIGSAIELLMQGQKEVARLQSCPFYSLWDNVGVNYYNKDRFFTWTVDEEGESRNDGTHPNKWAYLNVIAPKIIKQIALLW